MLIKSADHANDLSSASDTTPPAAIDSGLTLKQRLGQNNEQQTAHYINAHYANSLNYAVIHDLRLSFGGKTAQIDHVVIDRFLNVWILESKRFGQTLAINTQAEFSAIYSHQTYNIESPLEQNNRHAQQLRTLFSRGIITLPKRFGFTIKPRIRDLVLISTETHIERPSVPFPGLEKVIKADQVYTAIDTILRCEESNPLPLFKIISSATLQRFAEELASHHTPILSKPANANILSKPKNRNYFCYQCRRSVTAKIVKYCYDQRAKFLGKIYCLRCQAQQAAQSVKA